MEGYLDEVKVCKVVKQEKEVELEQQVNWVDSHHLQGGMAL